VGRRFARAFVVAVGIVLVFGASGCGARPAQDEAAVSRVNLPLGEPTATPEWGSLRSAPEMREVESRALEDYQTGAFESDAVMAGHRLGKGHFFGVVVSWIGPNAKIQMPPNSYAEVLVTIDGRIGPVPETPIPYGFITDGSTYGNDSDAMAAYKRDAVALARSYVGPGLDAGYGGIRGVTPYVSAYVVQYPWGFVVLTPALEMAGTASASEGEWPLLRVLPMSERQQLDSLTATAVAEAFLRNEDLSVKYWLTTPRGRYDFLAYLDYPGPRAQYPKTTVQLDEGAPAGASSLELSFRTVPPVVDETERLTVERSSVSSPWRVVGLGH